MEESKRGATQKTIMGSELDLAFIQAPEHRAKPTVAEAGGIPLIDLAPLLNTPISGGGDAPVPPALRGLVAEVEAACREWGFLQVINHGVPPEMVEKVMAAAKEFFALPPDEKRAVRRDEENPMGYYESEHTKNVRDWKEVFDFFVQETTVVPASAEPGVDEGLLEIRNQWPNRLPLFKEVCEEYTRGVTVLAFKLLELLALTLGLPAKRLNGFFEEQTSYLRFNHYPPCPTPDLALGVGHHTDSGALTVLYQDDVGGLEVKRQSSGEWVRVKPIPNSFIINIGDMVQVWSNGKYESAEHRVSVNSQRERFSIPFFLYPAHHVMVKPMEELVDEKNPARYREYNWGKFLAERKLSDFKKLGRELTQISHFRTADVWI